MAIITLRLIISKSSSPTCKSSETTSMFDPATAASPTLPTVVRQAVEPDRKEQSHASIVVTHVSTTTVWPMEPHCRARGKIVATSDFKAPSCE